jgi:uncharacterized membrane protein
MTHRVMTGAVWTVVVLGVLLGVAVAALRLAFVPDLAARAEPVRAQLASALDIDDPLAAQRPAEVRRFDSRFADHPVVAILHVGSGGLFLLLAPLQFSYWIRRRYIRFHRLAGRFLLGAGLATAASALFFGVLMPYGGWPERLAIMVFTALFLTALARAFAAIRAGRVARHREWMLRAFAIAFGISTIRIVGGVLDLVLTPFGFTVPAVFGLSLWSGWLLTLAGAELWIRHTRRRGDHVRTTLPGRHAAPARKAEVAGR